MGCALTLRAPARVVIAAFGQKFESQRARNRCGLDEPHRHAIAEAVGLAAAGADQGMVVFVVAEIIGADGARGDESVRAGVVELDEQAGADGFVPARTIGADYFRYHEDRHALIGARSGETHRLGDRVTVRLIEAAPVAGALRFELLSEGRYNGARRRRTRERPVREQRRARRERMRKR